jgi:phosphoesterase RecJ-like protein
MGHTVYVLLDDKDKDIAKIHANQHLITNEVTDEKYVFVALDLNELYRLGRYKKYFEPAEFTINIDHHQGNKTNADIVISDPDKSSTSEIIYNIFCAFGREYLDIDICESLYAGIMTDTSGFARRLSSNTLSIAQKLINKGINYEKVIRSTFSHRTLYELKALGRLIEEIKFDECLHYVTIDKSLEYYKDLTHNQITKTIAEELRKIEDMDIFLIFIKDGDILTTKCMSNVSKNANLIASQFNGGGHKGEAGFTVLKTSVEEVLEKTKAYLKSTK